MFFQILETTYEIIVGPGLDESILKNAFRRYLCTEGSDFCLKIEINPLTSHGTINALANEDTHRDVWFSRGQMDFVSKHISGFIDIEKQYGQFSVTPEKLLSSVSAILRCVAVVETVIRNGFVLHASCVVDDNLAYVFTGPSGSGKTTMASFANGAVKINDDTVLIAPHKNQYYVLGTPLWDNPEESTGRSLYSIKGIFKLQHGLEMQLDRLPAPFAAALLFTPPSFLQGDVLYNRLFENCAVAACKIPCYKLAFPKEPGVFDALKTYLDRDVNERMVKK